MKKIIKHERTSVKPLRSIGNFFGDISTDHIIKAVYLDDIGNNGLRYKYHAKMWRLLNIPYAWWGTYYEWDIDG